MADSEGAIPQIGSLVKDTALDGEKVRVDEILNKRSNCGSRARNANNARSNANANHGGRGSIRDKMNGITPMPCGLLSAESVSLA